LKHSYVFIIIFSLLVYFSTQTQAQDIYFSISGQNVAVNSGDSIHEYDFWFKPVDGITNPREAVVELFDAAIGSRADVVDHFRNTRTTFQWFAFNDIYLLGNQSIQKRGNQIAAKKEVITFTETEYINTWVPFFELNADQTSSPNGFLMRVRTDRGNDVNNFKIRITGDGADDWELITLNLSIGMVQTSPQNSFRIKPLWPESIPPVFILSGEEDSIVTLMDAFGETHPVNVPWVGYLREKEGVPNSWGVVMSGSALQVNNRVLRGRSEIVPFRFAPVLLPSAPDLNLSVQQQSTNSCNELIVSAHGNQSVFKLDEAVWKVDQSTFSGKQFRHEFTKVGYFPYELRVPTSGILLPKYQMNTGYLHVNAPPVARVTGHRDRIAPGQELVYNASNSFDPEGGSLKFEWYVNDELKSTLPVFRFTTFQYGTYTIRLVLDDAHPGALCTQTEQTFQVTINTRPFAEIDFKQVIAPNTSEQALMKNAVVTDSDKVTFLWKGLGITGSITDKEVSVLHSTPGVYSLSLTIDDGFGALNSIYTTEFQYRVNAAPVPSFSIPDIDAPLQRIVLDARNSRDPDRDALSFTWNISDGRTLHGAIQEIQFDSPGEYQIELVVNDGQEVANSTQRLMRTIRINQAPESIFSAPSITNMPIVLFDGSKSAGADKEIVSYTWNFGDGSVANGPIVEHTFKTHGTFSVSLTVDDGTNVANSRTTSIQEVTVNKNPIAVIDAPQRVAPDTDVIFDGSKSFDSDGEIVSYSWYKNGVLIGTDPILKTRFEHPGSQFVTLVVRDNSPLDDAIGSAFVEIDVNHPPIIQLSEAPPVTAPETPTRFKINPSLNKSAHITWEFSDGEKYEGQVVERTFSRAGLITYTITANDGKNLANSIVSKEGSVRVNASPVMITASEIRSNSSTIRLDASQSYDPEGNPLSFRWVLPNGDIRTESAFTWVAPEPGINIIALTVNDGEGQSNSNVNQRISVLVNRAPVPVLPNEISSCVGQIVLFSSANSYDPDGDGFTTFWNFGDGNTSSLANPVHRYDQPGFYTARVYLDDGMVAEPSIGEVPVIIEGAPQARITRREFTVCANTPVIFDGSDSTAPNERIGSYSWDFGDGNSGVGEQISHVFTEPGVYRVALSITGSGSGRCSNSSEDFVEITVVSAPKAIFRLTEVVSPGTALFLDASASETTDAIKQVRWQIRKDGALLQELNGLQQSFNPTIPGIYEITLLLTTDNDSGCSNASNTQRVRVNKAPVLVWNLPETWNQHEPFRLSAVGSTDQDGFVKEYTWKVDGEILARGVSADLPVSEARTLEIELIIRDNSTVDNSEVRKKGFVRIIPKHIAAFDLPPVVYKNSRVSLVPKYHQTLDGLPLNSVWMVNGEVLTSNDFIASANTYTIALIQKVEGSDRSAYETTRVLHVKHPEPLDVSIPDRIISGERLDASQLGLPENFTLFSNQIPIQTWIAGAPGQQIIHIAWVAEGQMREVYEFQTEVVESLKATQLEIFVYAPYNPLNSSVIAQAPSVNRSSDLPVSYMWVNTTGKIVAVGSQVHLPVERGRNSYMLHIKDVKEIHGSKPLMIPVTVEVK